jgi:two-component system response regulator QseB
MTPARLLLVEDDADLRAMLTELLTDSGYAVAAAADGQRGLHLGLTQTFDVLLLDRRLPVVEGIDLLAGLRARGVTTPVLMLSAIAQPADRVAGLDAGAEDYLGKPFDVDELLARLRSLVRRAGTEDGAEMIDLGVRRLDVAARLVVGDGPDVQLSEREAGLLRTLAGRPTRVFTRDELRDRVFGDAETDAVVETYVSYLRRKLGPDAVRTVRGVGYRMGTV